MTEIQQTRSSHSVAARRAGTSQEFRHCLKAEANEARARGIRFDAKQFLASHPDLSVDDSGLIDAAYEEYCQRVEAGEELDVAAYCDQFPAVAETLAELIGTHQICHALYPASSDLVREYVEPLLPVPWPDPADRITGFELIQELARGKFARVYLAEESALGRRQVVLKVARQGGLEAQTLGRLQHPNIIPIHSFHQEPDSDFTVVCMPYLGRATLGHVLCWIRQQSTLPRRAEAILKVVAQVEAATEKVSETAAPAWPFPSGSYVEGVLSLGAQVADALAWVHAQGICHLDLKPANVLLTREGRPLLLDFNLAVSKENPGSPWGGTMPYMSPEQLQAIRRPKQPGAAPLSASSDVFALGVILYELLAARHPFDAPAAPPSDRDLEVQRLRESQVRGPRLLRWRELRIGRQAAHWIERCLAVAPAQRPTAAELAAGLRQSLSAPGRMRRWLEVHPWLTTSAAGLVLAAGLAGGHAWASREPDQVRTMKQGWQAYHQGRFDQAVAHFEQAQRTQPSSAGILYALGRAHEQRADDRQALACYQEANRLAPDARIQACLGSCLGRLQLHREAIHHQTQAIEAGWDTAEIHNNLAYSYLQLGKAGRSQAETVLEQALKQKPTLAAAYHNRAWLNLETVLETSGRPRSASPAGSANAELPLPLTQALADARRAMELGGPNAEVLQTLAYLQAVAARYQDAWAESAIDHLARAIDQGLDPGLVANDSLFRNLRHRPRFAALVRDVTGPGSPLRTSRIVDPVPGEAAE